MIRRTGMERMLQKFFDDDVGKVKLPAVRSSDSQHLKGSRSEGTFHAADDLLFRPFKTYTTTTPFGYQREVMSEIHPDHQIQNNEAGKFMVDVLNMIYSGSSLSSASGTKSIAEPKKKTKLSFKERLKIRRDKQKFEKSLGKKRRKK